MYVACDQQVLLGFFPSHANCRQLATEKPHSGVFRLDNDNGTPCNKPLAKHMSEATSLWLEYYN